MNTDNRPMSKSNLETLKREFSKGHYKFNGDAIRISRHGRLLDGQHRLQAVISTGITIKALVIYGLPDDVFPTIDQNKVRTFGDILGMEKIKNYGIAAGIVPLLMAYNSGNVPASKHRISKQELLDYFNEHPSIVEAAHYVASQSGILKKWLTPSYLGFLYVIFKEKDPNLCEYFLNRVASGENLDPKSPEWKLREKLMQVSACSGIRDDIKQLSAYVIKAWNAVREKKEIKIFRYNYSGPSAEGFPKAI